CATYSNYFKAPFAYW
nr:immunoglobulin heavy chain junction region [Mus musculus]